MGTTKQTCRTEGKFVCRPSRTTLLASAVRHLKLAWLERVARHDRLSKAILQETVEGGRRRGGQSKSLTLKSLQDVTLSRLSVLLMTGSAGVL